MEEEEEETEDEDDVENDVRDTFGPGRSCRDALGFKLAVASVGAGAGAVAPVAVAPEGSVCWDTPSPSTRAPSVR